MVANHRTTSWNVFDSNNLAVAYLMFGDLEQAHFLLVDAFVETSTQVLAMTQGESSAHEIPAPRGSPKNNTTAAAVRGRTNSSTEPPSLHTSPILPRECLLNTLDRAFAGGDDRRTQALMIAVPEFSNQEPVSNLDWFLIAAFIVYNLGVLYLASPPPFEPRRQRRNENRDEHLRQARMVFASAKALLQEATQSSTFTITGNPLVDLLSLLIAFELAETTRDLEGESELQQRYQDELLDLVSRMEAALCYSTFYNDSEVSRLLRRSCHVLILQCILLGGRCQSLSAAADRNSKSVTDRQAEKYNEPPRPR